MTRSKFFNKVNTPTVLQMEAVECGAAALAMILGYYGHPVSLEMLRFQCGVNRDGSKANHILHVANQYHLKSTGLKVAFDELDQLTVPLIAFWDQSHFLVVEGWNNHAIFVNDPAVGKRQIEKSIFKTHFSDIVLTFEKTPEFTTLPNPNSFLKRLTAFATQDVWTVTYLIGLSLMMSVPIIVMSGLIKLNIDAVFIENRAEWAFPLLGWFLGAAFGWELMRFLNAWILDRLTIKLSIINSSRFVWMLLGYPFYYFTQRSASQIMEKIQLHDQQSTIWTQAIFQAFLNGLVLVCLITGLIFYQPILGGCTLVAFVVFGGVKPFFSVRKNHFFQNFIIEDLRLKAVTSYGIRAMESIKITGTEKRFFKIWSSVFTAKLNLLQKIGINQLIQAAIGAWFEYSLIGFLLVAGSFLIIQGHLSIGTFFAFHFLLLNIFSELSLFYQLERQLSFFDQNEKKRNDFVESNNRESIGSEQVRMENQPFESGAELVIRDLTFGYNVLNTPLIKALSITLHSSEHVAIIGPPGSGKTTLVKLLKGLLKPWEGTIQLNGRDLLAYSPAFLSHIIAYVSAHPQFFEGTIRENLTLWNEKITEPQLIQAAKDADIHGEITSRENGYESKINENALNFSSGERRRLDLARALVYNPRILVLDDAFWFSEQKKMDSLLMPLKRRDISVLFMVQDPQLITECSQTVVLRAFECPVVS